MDAKKYCNTFFLKSRYSLRLCQKDLSNSKKEEEEEEKGEEAREGGRVRGRRKVGRKTGWPASSVKWG